MDRYFPPSLMRSISRRNAAVPCAAHRVHVCIVALSKQNSSFSSRSRQNSTYAGCNAVGFTFQLCSAESLKRL